MFSTAGIHNILALLKSMRKFPVSLADISTKAYVTNVEMKCVF